MIITILRKPVEGTVAENTLKHGCGSINIDASRIGSGHHLPLGKVTSKKLAGDGGFGAGSGREGERGGFIPRSAEGRWPANFILTRDEDRESCPIEALDEQSGLLRARGNIGASKGGGGMFGHGSVSNNFGAGDEGGASRFFKHFKKEKKA